MDSLVPIPAPAEQETTVADMPVDTLPNPLRAFVEPTAMALGVPNSLMALPTLAGIGALIGNARHIELKPGWTEPPSIYAAIVADSGQLKSPAMDAALKPIITTLTPPTVQRRWTSDVTTEKLAMLLQEQPRGILIVRDELTGWVRGMNQYKGGRGADNQFYLSTWGGSPLAVDRKDGTQIYLSQPFVSVVGGLPPDCLPQLDASGGLADGFLPRLLFAWSEPFGVRWSDEVVPPEVTEKYDQLVTDLHQLSYDNNTPVRLNLTEDGKKLFVEWHDSHCAEGEDANLSGYLQGAYAKLKGYCARLALIHALCTDPTATSVNDESVAAAAGLIEYFKGEAKKVDAALGRGKNHPVELCKAAIRRQLSVCRCLKKRDLQRKMNANADIFNQAIAEMRLAEVTVGISDGQEVVYPNRKLTP